MRHYPDPEEHSPHWKKCGNEECWLCNPPSGVAERLVAHTRRETESEQEQPEPSPPPRPCFRGTPYTFEDALDIMYARCREVMIDRHRKYGPGNIFAFGKQGVVVRLSDKLERLKNLLFGGKGVEADDEKELDTWIDIANYGVIGMLLLAGMWGQPMKEDKDAPDRPSRVV